MGGEGGVSNGKVSGFHAAEFTFSRLAATFISVCRGGIYCARRRVSEANRRAAAALRPEIPPAGVCAGAGCGGMRASRPTVVPYVPHQPGTPRVSDARNLCRGGFHCARRRVSEANRTVGPALRPEIPPGLRRRGVFRYDASIVPYIGLWYRRVCCFPVGRVVYPGS